MELNTLTRKATLSWLETLRVPLSAAELVAKRSGRETATWAPSLAFGAFEVAVKDTVGRLTGDDTLEGLARLQRAEIGQRREAVEKQLEADDNARRDPSRGRHARDCARTPSATSSTAGPPSASARSSRTASPPSAKSRRRRPRRRRRCAKPPARPSVYWLTRRRWRKPNGCAPRPRRWPRRSGPSRPRVRC